MSNKAVIGIIGGGLIGLATAWKVARLGLAKKIIVLEKEPTVCSHQSGRNSGVLHCGLYYKPGSLKAKLAVGGLAEMVDFCRDHSIAYDICGKVVVATNAIEEKRLLSLQERGTANGLDGLSILEPQEIARLEPHVRGTLALHVPQEGIVDYAAVGRALVCLLEDAGHEIRTNHAVTSITSTPHGVKVGTDQANFEFSHIINCAGLHSDRIYRLSGHRSHSTIIPFRGEYFSLSPKGTRLVNNLIYPVPDPDFPFLGVHFTRMIGGGILAGPNAALVLHREGYSRFSISPRDAIETLTFPGLSKFLLRYPKASWLEFTNSISKSVFLKNLQKLIPEITMEDLGTRHPSGVRAQAMTPDGNLQMDFEICEEENQIHVVNAPSPGATASLAIGGHIAGRLQAAMA